MIMMLMVVCALKGRDGSGAGGTLSLRHDDDARNLDFDPPKVEQL
jgi:hypothetical protein